MIVPINSLDKSRREWALLELQGDLEASSTDPHSGQFLGDLHYNKNGTPIMILGMHVLHGKETILAKPMAIFEKKKLPDSVEYVIKGMIKKKVTFRGRPKPIVTDVPLTV